MTNSYDFKEDGNCKLFFGHEYTLCCTKIRWWSQLQRCRRSLLELISIPKWTWWHKAAPRTAETYAFCKMYFFNLIRVKYWKLILRVRKRLWKQSTFVVKVTFFHIALFVFCTGKVESDLFWKKVKSFNLFDTVLKDTFANHYFHDTHPVPSNSRIDVKRPLSKPSKICSHKSCNRVMVANTLSNKECLHGHTTYIVIQSSLTSI